MKYLKQSENHAIWQDVKSNPCCDHVVITEQEVNELEELFHLKFVEHIPSDLIVANMIPLKNLKLTLVLKNKEVFETKFHIFNNYTPQDIEKEKSKSVGVLELSDDVFTLIDVEYGKNIVFYGRCGFRYDDSKTYLRAIGDHREFVSKKYREEKDFDAFISRYTGMMMEAFYVIQVAMLHPITKQLFRKPSLYPIKDSGMNSCKKKKRITRYVKKYYIDPLELGSVTKREPGVPKKYSCLAWYVCGHWRTYQNGTKVFIQPYWKGAMRNERQYVENIERTRKIGQLEEQR